MRANTGHLCASSSSQVWSVTPAGADALEVSGKRRRKARREHAVTRLGVRARADALRGRLNMGPSSPK